TIMVFQNYQVEGERGVYTGEKGTVKFKFTEGFEQLGHDFNIYIIPDNPILVGIGFNGLVYDEGFLKGVETKFKKLAELITENPDLEIKAIKLKD
ncbi:MAG: hypothetical protein GY757_42185, partial [bacterium]|nr:hypothetical protein [bacterium]